MDGPAEEEWFMQDVLPHEHSLRRYLSRFLPQPTDIADVVQDTYARLLLLSTEERTRIRSVKAFLLRTARNVALDRLRRQPVVSLDAMVEIDECWAVDEAPSAYEEISARQELALLARVMAGLPERCRQVLTLRKVFGMSQREIAARLRISENTVETHVANGMRLCAQRVFALSEGGPGTRDAACGVRGWRGTGDVE